MNSPLVRDTLSNGVQLMIRESPHMARFGAQLLVRTGSSMDPPGLKGLAHLVEHVILREVGARGTDLWARTYFDYTSYTVASREFPEFERLLARFGSVLKGLAEQNVSDLSLDRARAEMSEEISRSYAHPRAGMQYRVLYETAFGTHHYDGYPLGRPDHLGKMSGNDVRGFIAEHYVPGDLAVWCRGPFSSSRLSRALKESFGPLAPKARPPRPMEPAAPQKSLRRKTLVSDAPVDRLLVGFKFPPLDPRLAISLALIKQMLFFAPIGNVSKNLQKGQMMYWTFLATRSPGLFEFFVESDARASGAEKLVMDSCALLRRGDFIEAQFSEAKRSYLERLAKVPFLPHWELLWGEEAAVDALVSIGQDLSPLDMQKTADEIFHDSRATEVVSYGHRQA